jgi:hypothetical protein
MSRPRLERYTLTFVRCSVRIYARTKAVVTAGFPGSPQSFRTNAGRLPQLSRDLPFHILPNTAVTLSSHATDTHTDSAAK